MKLAGLDFETANCKSGSICAAGCAVLEDGIVVDRREWLVCPHKGYRWMRSDFTDIHGLSLGCVRLSGISVYMGGVAPDASFCGVRHNPQCPL